MFYITPNRIRVGPKNQTPILDTDVPMPHLLGYLKSYHTMQSSLSYMEAQTINSGSVNVYVTKPDFLITRAKFTSVTGGTSTIKGQTIDSARFVPIGANAPYVWFQGSQLVSASVNQNGVTERKVLHVYVEYGYIQCSIQSYRAWGNYEEAADPEFFSFELDVWYGMFGEPNL
jgi:hypothetical protein